MNARLLFLRLPTLIVAWLSTFCVATFLIYRAGPFWYSDYTDPTYAYLLNSVNLARWISPSHIDHPGTPVQVIGAAIIKINHWLYSTDPLAIDVVLRSDSYLEWIRSFFFVSYFIFLGLSCYYLLYAQKQTALAYLTLFSPLIFSPILARFLLVCSEFGIILAFPLCIALLIVSVYGPPKKITRVSATLGLVIGFSCASKIVFAPMFIIPFFVFSKTRDRINLFIFSLLGFGLSVLPIYKQLFQFFVWIKNIALYSGHYGTGQKDFVNFSEVPQNALTLFTEVPIYFLILGLTAVFLIRTKIIHRERTLTHPDPEIRLIGANFFAQSILVLAVLKHPSVNYLVPGLLMCLVSLPALIRRFLRSDFYKVTLYSLLAMQSFLGIFWVYRLTNDVRKDAEKIEQEIRTNYPTCTLISALPASSEALAVNFGNMYSRLKFTDEITRAYPEQFSYFPANRALLKASSLSSPANPFELSKCVLVRGRRSDATAIGDCIGPFKVNPIYLGRKESLYIAERMEPRCEE